MSNITKVINEINKMVDVRVDETTVLSAIGVAAGNDVELYMDMLNDYMSGKSVDEVCTKFELPEDVVNVSLRFATCKIAEQVNMEVTESMELGKLNCVDNELQRHLGRHGIVTVRDFVSGNVKTYNDLYCDKEIDNVKVLRLANVLYNKGYTELKHSCVIYCNTGRFLSEKVHEFYTEEMCVLDLDIPGIIKNRILGAGYNKVSDLKKVGLHEFCNTTGISYEDTAILLMYFMERNMSIFSDKAYGRKAEVGEV